MSPKPNKTHATALPRQAGASVDAFIDKQPKASSSRAASDRGAEIGKEVRDDCRALMKLMHELTGAEPYMYGPAIVGYGIYHYTYASGHSGSAPLAAFSPRKPELVIYFAPGIFEQEPELMKKLGKCRTTKGCLYVKRLADLRREGAEDPAEEVDRAGAEDLSAGLNSIPLVTWLSTIVAHRHVRKDHDLGSIMRTTTTSLALSLALLAFAQSPPPILWQKCLGNAEGDGGTLVCPANDGGWFVAIEGQFLLSQTSMSDIRLVKLNAAGSVEWDQPLGGSGPDFPYALVGTSDGGCAVVGETWSSNGDVSGYHGGHDGWVVKVDGQGDMEWQRCIGGTWDDKALGVLGADDGGCIITGLSSSSDGDMIGQHGGQDAWVAKLDATGNLEWLRLMGGSGIELPRSIVPLDDGGWLLGIRSSSDDGDVSGAHGNMDAWLVKLDGGGNIAWQHTYGGSLDDRLANALPTSDGGCVFAAMTVSDNGDVTGHHGQNDYWLVKVDAAGALEWQKAMGGSHWEGATELIPASDGGYFINGYTESIDGDVLDQHSSVTGVRDIWVVKVSGAGDVLWTRALGGSEADEPFFDMEENDIPHTLVATADGGCVVVGRTGSSDGDVTGLHGSGDLDAWAVMLAGSGALLWQRALGGGLPDFATQVHLSSNDELLVSGITYSNDGDVSGNNGASDAWVVKLGSIASGMDETTVAGFVMTPSPASDQVHLRLEGASMGTIQFTDLAGRRALNVRMTGGVTTIDVATLARGCYVVTVQPLSGVRRSQRLILE